MLSRNIASRRSRSLLARAVRAKSTQVQESSGPIAADGRHEVLNEGGFDSEIKWVKNHQNEHGTFLKEGNLYERPRRILRRDTKIISSAKKNGMQQRFPPSKRGIVGWSQRKEGWRGTEFQPTHYSKTLLLSKLLEMGSSFRKNPSIHGTFRRMSLQFQFQLPIYLSILFGTQPLSFAFLIFSSPRPIAMNHFDPNK